MSGWSIAKAPTPTPPHLVPQIRKLLGVKKHRSGVWVYCEIWQYSMRDVLREAGLPGIGE